MGSCGNRMSWYLAKFSCVCRRCYEMWCSSCIDYGTSDVTMNDGKTHKVCPDCYKCIMKSKNPCSFDKAKYDKIKNEGNRPCEKPECDNILSWNRVHFGWHGCRSCFAMCCEEHLSSTFAKDVKMDDRKNHR